MSTAGRTACRWPSCAWEPASPTGVAQIFSSSPARWWIAGGYAIELAAGRQIREHGDIDVLVLRPDQLAVQHVLPSWQWYTADPPGTLRPWRQGEQLPAGVHDIWCRPGPVQAWQLQVMLDESCAGHWVSRRDRRIRRPIDSIGAVTANGILYLAPEIQLFYKAKDPRPAHLRDRPCVVHPSAVTTTRISVAIDAMAAQGLTAINTAILASSTGESSQISARSGLLGVLAGLGVA